MLFQFACILVFAVVAVGFIAVSLAASSLVRPKVDHPDKSLTYECGERPVGSAWFQFNMRFYIVALIFVIFDLEIVFMVPVLVVFRKMVDQGIGWIVFLEIAAFVGILLVGLAYVWVKRDIDWVKPMPRTLGSL